MQYKSPNNKYFLTVDFQGSWYQTQQGESSQKYEKDKNTV